MIPVYICDDDNAEREYITKAVENFILIQGYDMKVVLSAAGPEEVLADRAQRSERAVYFLDVDLKDPSDNGFTLAKKLRGIDPRGFLVFVTTHEEMIFETFKYRLEAMSYLIKDEPKKLTAQIRECLAEIQQLISSEQHDQRGYYTVKAGDISYHIPVDEILFFETAATNHRIILHTLKRILEFRGDLNTVEKELGNDFVRIHRSYLVRFEQIEQFHYNEQKVVMNGSAICLMSRKGRRLLHERENQTGAGNQ